MLRPESVSTSPVTPLITIDMYNKKFTSLETEKEIAIASDIPSTQSKDEEASLCSNDFEPDLRLYLALYSLAAGIIVVAVNDGLISTASAV